MSALQHSTYWYFKKTASRIGPARMLAALRQLRYGNAEIGDGNVRWFVVSS